MALIGLTLVALGILGCQSNTSSASEGEAIAVLQFELRKSLNICLANSQRDSGVSSLLLLAPDAVCSEEPILKAFGAGRAMRGLRVPFLLAYGNTLLEHGHWTAEYNAETQRWEVEGSFRELPGEVWTFYIHDVTKEAEGLAPSVQASPLEQLSAGDAARRFALESGAAPGFRDFVTDRALKQVFPFAIQQAMKAQQNEVLDPQSLSVNEFEGFLRVTMAGDLPNIGQSLRLAADFLRSPDWERGVFTPQ